MKHLLVLFSILTLHGISSCKKGDDPGTGKDLILTATEQRMANASNQFTLELFREVLAEAPDNSNTFISPLSVGIALSMTANGAKGETLEEMREALQLEDFSTGEINEFYHKLITELPALDPKTTLKIANSVWFRNTFSVLPAFLKANADYYRATAEGLDFTQTAAKDKINNWVNTATGGKIPDIIDNIPSDMVMYLINAVYFKGSWKYKFDKAQTKKQAFYLRQGTTVQADFMTANTTFNIFGNQHFTIAELPYGNEKYSMMVLLPGSNQSTAQLAASLDSETWSGLTAGLTQTSNTIVLPKFTFTDEMKLNNRLKSLGMTAAFSERADFTGINSEKQLQISEVKHKTFIEVNEEGTEAAAVTSVGIVTTSAPPSLIFNRPFLFAIREMKTGLILFIGMVNNPLLSGK